LANSACLLFRNLAMRRNFVSMEDIGRFTRDVDLTVALELDEFAQLMDRLIAAGWR
jgi:hypothetical protein